MAYLELELEERCLAVRDLFLTWLSRKRVGTGDLAFVRIDGRLQAVPLSRGTALLPGDYQELQIESRTLVLEHPDDPKLIAQLDSALSSLIVELKAVMAY